MKIGVIGVICFGITACGGNTKTISCAENDWEVVGYKTAMSGKSVRTFEQFKQECSGLNKLAKDRYLDGYMRAIPEYCTYKNGYELGSNSRDFSDVCPIELRKKFSEGFENGKRDLADRKRDIESIGDSTLRDKASDTYFKTMSIPK